LEKERRLSWKGREGSGSSEGTRVESFLIRKRPGGNKGQFGRKKGVRRGRKGKGKIILL